jgi:hypothetical protein
MASIRRTFIVRILQSDDGSVVGQINDLHDGERRPFRDADELWRILIAGDDELLGLGDRLGADEEQ